jgi:hypothetical protein
MILISECRALSDTGLTQAVQTGLELTTFWMLGKSITTEIPQLSFLDVYSINLFQIL